MKTIKELTIKYDDDSEQVFVEKDAVVTPPVEPAYEITKNEVTAVTETEATINFVTEVPTQAHIEYWKVGSSEDVKRGAREESFNYSDHTQVLRELEPGAQYGYQVITNNEAGDEVKSKVKFFETLAAIEAPALNKLYQVLCCINWADMDQIPVTDISEGTYFVLTVGQDGQILGTNQPLEAAFVRNMHSAGKRATFSLGGSAQYQSASDLKRAVEVNTDAFIRQIKNHIDQNNYNGVTANFEGTSINPIKMAEFFQKLRSALGNQLVIGCYTQMYQRNSVWAELAEVGKHVDWLSPMVYDAPDIQYTTESIIEQVAKWEAVGKEKLLCGIAVNYNTLPGNVTTEVYGELIDEVLKRGWGGFAIWQNTIFTNPWREVQRSKITPA